MHRKPHLDPFAIGLMVLLCAVWGFQQVAVKLTMPAVSPLLQAGLRSSVAVVLLLAWARARHLPLTLRDGSLIPGITIGVMFAAEFALLYWGLSYTSASRAVVFLYTAPFVVAAGVHWLVPGEALGRWQLAGLVSAFAGILVAFMDNVSLPEGRQLVGDLLALGAAIAWGATTVFIRASRLVRLSATKTLFYQLAVSALLLPPASMALGETGFGDASPIVWAALAYQSVVVAFASYLAWFWLITRYPAGHLSAFSFLTPLFGMLFGALVLGEKITPQLGLAMGLVAVGLVMVNRRSRAATSSAKPSIGGQEPQPQKNEDKTGAPIEPGASAR